MILSKLRFFQLQKIQIVLGAKSSQTQYWQYFQRTIYFNNATLVSKYIK